MIRKETIDFSRKIAKNCYEFLHCHNPKSLGRLQEVAVKMLHVIMVFSTEKKQMQKMCFEKAKLFERFLRIHNNISIKLILEFFRVLVEVSNKLSIY